LTNKSILIITDGIGHNKKDAFNAFKKANTPTYDYLFKNVPYSLIKTYGKHVGLPNSQMGNSEVGHMTIGSGRLLYQDLVKINLSIEDNSINNNKVLNKVIKSSNDIHLIGLISDGGVHSHIDHIIKLALIAKDNSKKIFLHIITDGRDVNPKSSNIYIQKIINICNNDIKIATISGRYYTMDRDNNWDRIEKAYLAIVFGETNSNILEKNDILKYIKLSYEKNIYDEFIYPNSFNNYEGFKENDGVILCNFRSDRMRQFSNTLANQDFNIFNIFNKKLNIVSMTKYDENIKIPILFKKSIPKNTLSEVISNNGLTQLHTAETEKYAHVTFFFNGGVEEPFINESRVLVPSPSVKTYDMLPQMSAQEVTNSVLTGIEEEYDFIVVNFANGDMVGHTGNFEAAIKAVECVDEQLKIILENAKKNNYNLVITSDHGNCEKMKDEKGNTLTNHTVGDVYCFVVCDIVSRVKNGSLNNIAPTILKLMNIKKPKEMDKPLI
jgi:2,3-bisphosphoglycerate-independent phosphoglycerate mutase